MNEELTAQGAVEPACVPLAGETELLADPVPGAAVLEILPADALLTFKQDAGAYIHVITTGEKFGYISDATLVHAVSWTPDVERRTEPERHVYPGAPVSARGCPACCEPPEGRVAAAAGCPG
jgi:hypothetical protein